MLERRQCWISGVRAVAVTERQHGSIRVECDVEVDVGVRGYWHVDLQLGVHLHRCRFIRFTRRGQRNIVIASQSNLLPWSLPDCALHPLRSASRRCGRILSDRPLRFMRAEFPILPVVIMNSPAPLTPFPRLTLRP